jgi:hypothetical protein
VIDDIPITLTSRLPPINNDVNVGWYCELRWRLCLTLADADIIADH